MELPEYEKVLSEFLTPSDIEHGYEMYPDDYKNIAIEYGKQLLDYAEEEVERYYNSNEDVHHDLGLLESITNIKKQLK